MGEGEEDLDVDVKTVWSGMSATPRLFTHLQRLADLDGDRVRLVIGAGQVPIPLHVAREAPQFELPKMAGVLMSL